jgi:hypothetical protein
MLSAAIVTVVVLLLAATALPDGVRPKDMVDAIRWFSLLSLPLMICIAALARHRFFTPEDIDGSGLTQGTERARVLQSILQNTLEQTALAFVGYLGFASVASAARLGVIPAAVLLFLIGRAAFAYGYASGAAGRAFGFALTFYPTVAVCVASALLFLTGLL